MLSTHSSVSLKREMRITNSWMNWCEKEQMHLVMLWDKQMGTDPTHSERCRARENALSSRICYLKACMCNLEKRHSSDCAVAY